MIRKRTAGALAFFLLAVELFSAYVYAYTLIADWRAHEMEWFELIARLLGYALALTCGGLTAAGLYRYGKTGREEKCFLLATRFAFGAVLLLCVHDGLLFLTYGNQLEGTFTMAAFFVMDAALLLAYSVILKSPLSPARPLFWGAAAFLWLLYIFGDMAGYPASAIQDWDEALMKFSFLCHALALLWLTRQPRATA